MACGALLKSHGLPNTRWSEVNLSKDTATEEGLAALDSLLTRYRPAVITYLRTKFNISQEDAEDTFQAFVEKKILVQNLLRHAEPARGRFRDFLLTSVRHFAISEIRRRRSRKRTPETDAVPLHFLREEQLPRAADPEADGFGLTWSTVVINSTLRELRDRCYREERQSVWEVLWERTLSPMLEDSPPTAYEELVARYAFNSPSEAFNTLHTGKRMFRRHMRNIVAEYATGAAEVEEELAYLRRLCESWPRRA